MTNGE
ncbi:hypothetical protein YPPY52_2639, partial [Yersinia pestis PY-52]